MQKYLFGISSTRLPLGLGIILSLLFFNIHTSSLLAQQTRYYALIRSDEDLKAAKVQKSYFFSSEQKRAQFLQELLAGLHQKNWLEASIDSIAEISPDSILVYLHLGKRYQLNASLPEMDAWLVKRNGRRTRTESQEAGNIPQMLQGIEAQLGYWQENGYPFASIYWDTLKIGEDTIYMQALIDKGPLILMDSLKNMEDSKVSESYLRAYLGVRKEMPYKESILATSDQLLRKLPFARFVRPSTINFQGNKANMNVYLANRKVSRFDFLIGVLPNNANTGKILLTGEARMQLLNAFRQGEEILMEWKRVQVNSQQLRLRFNYPFLLNSPIGINTNFRLDKRDSTFLDLTWSLGVPFRTKGNNYVKAGIENIQTIVLRVDTNFVKQFNRLPRIQDVSSLMYGFEGYFENLDYLFNPRRGLEMLAGIQLGTRKIKPNTAILKLEPPFSTLYDSLDLKSLQVQFKAMFNSYIPISKRQVVKLGLRAEGRTNPNILENELFRIGGFNLLRGFDEESLFVQYYSVLTAEYRFVLQQNSYMYAFVDAAYTGRPRANDFQHDFPFGFGAGMAFETKAGIFGINYAVGRQQGNPVDFRSSKIHFGYVNIF